MDEIVMIITKVLSNSVVLSPLQDTKMEHILSAIEFDKPDSLVWTSLGYDPTPVGFFFQYNTWDISKLDWINSDYPKNFNKD